MSDTEYDERTQQAREALEQAVLDALMAGVLVVDVRESVEYVIETKDEA